MSNEATNTQPVTVEEPAARASGLATASLVLGILSIVVGLFFALGWVLGLLAAILGSVAQRRSLSNLSAAKAGMWLGIVGFVLTIVVVFVHVMQASS